MGLWVMLLRVREDTHETSWMILLTGSLSWNRSGTLVDLMRFVFLALDWGTMDMSHRLAISEDEPRPRKAVAARLVSVYVLHRVTHPQVHVNGVKKKKKKKKVSPAMPAEAA
jgi:hypothetical protein